MIVEHCTIYDSWDEGRFTLPECSRLYNLEPIKIGVHDVESLTSYISRLAEAHCVKVECLIVNEILPYFGTNSIHPRSLSTLNFTKSSYLLNGSQTWATNCIKSLEYLTKRDDLSFLTMVTWSNVISEQNFIRTQRAWCPECYNEWLENNEIIYDPLIWSLNAIVVCPFHRRLLALQCPHQSCRRSLPMLAPNTRPGFCSHCEKWLGLNTNIASSENIVTSDTELQWHTWVREAMGEFLSAAPNLVEPPARKKATHLFSEFTKQTSRHLAKVFGIPTSTIKLWKRGNIPATDTLIRLCYCFDVSPFHLLTGNIDLANISPRPLPENVGFRRKSRGNYNSLDLVEARRKLNLIILSDDPPLPFSQVARDLGHDVIHLRRCCPEECQKISEKFAAHRRAAAEAKRQIVHDEVRQQVLLLHEQNIYPSKRRLRALLKPGYMRLAEAENAWRETLLELGLKAKSAN